MPVAVGIYLPLSLDIPILTGGLIRFILSRRRSGRADAGSDIGRGVLFGSGLIAGEALLGILIAIPISINPHWLPEREGYPIFSLAVFAAIVAFYFWFAGRRIRSNMNV